MKKIRFLFILNIMFFSKTSNAQLNIYGNWRIDNYIGVSDISKYSMVRQEENNPFGKMLTLNLDGTFLNRNLPECGNDTFVNIVGNFLIIDDNHIRFILRKKQRVDNEFNNSASELNVDLGVFYIYKEGKTIRLITSNGVLQDDKDKMLYEQMVKTFNEEWRSYNYVWKNTDKKEPEEIIKDCIEREKLIEWPNCKTVFSSSGGNFFIIKENDKFHYIIYDSYKKRVSLASPKNKI